MATELKNTPIYTDFSGLTRLKAEARADSQAALGKVARQFETIFTQMMLHSMRTASLGDGALDSDQSLAYRDMLDQQLAMNLSGKGKGLGIAQMLVRQLSNHAQQTPVASTIKPLNSGSSTEANTPYSTAATSAIDLLKLRMGLRNNACLSASASPLSVAAKASTVDGTSVDADMASAEINAPAKTSNATLSAIASSVASKLSSDPSEFVKSLMPYASAVAQKLGVSIRAVLAQAALETGWGRHMPQQAGGTSSFNLFGLKAGNNWSGDRTQVATVEVENGVAVQRTASFRAYSSLSGSFGDYAQLLTTNPRYTGVLGHGDDVAGFAHALQTAGYATDPAYAAKLVAIANGDSMNNALAKLKESGALPSI